MGTLLIQIFDHLVFGCGCGRWESKDRLRELKREVLMWGAASWSVCGVAVGPPVITRLPLTVHLTATSWTCGGVIAASSLLRALQSISSFTQSSFLMPRVAKSTSRLGLGGWAPATAKKVQGGFLRGADNFCLLLPAVVSLLEGGGAFFKASTALDSCMSESWIFWSSRFGTMSAVGSGWSRGIALANEFFDDRVGDEGKEVWLYFSQPNVW